MAQVLAPVGVGSNNGEIVTLADGGFMAVWTHQVSSLIPISGVTDDSFQAILGRVFNADGTPRGSVFQVNETTADGQLQPDITLLSNGNVAVAWTDGPNTSDFDVAAKVKILSPTGTAVSAEMDVSTVTADEQRLPQVAPTDDGGFVVVWRDDGIDQGESHVYQQFSATGTAVGERVFIRQNVSDENSQLLDLGDNTFTIVGEQGNTFRLGDTYRESAGFLRAADPGNGGESNFNPFKFGDDYVADGAGNAVSINAFANRVTVQFWSKQERENFRTSDYPDGTSPVETVFDLNRDDNAVSRIEVELGNGINEFSGVTDGLSAAGTYLSDGTVLVVWTAVTGGEPLQYEYSVFAQRLSAEGVILSDAIVIEDENVQGSPIAPPFVSAGADGKAFIGWTGTTDRNGAGTNELMGGVFDIPVKDQSIQTSGDDSIVATPGDDVIEYGAGDDTVSLLDGNDLWIGGAPDGLRLRGEIRGMGGDDTFALRTEGDFGFTLIGGSGTDTMDFSLFTAGTGLPRPSEDIERVIGTLFDDTGSVGNGAVDEGLYIHTEAGNDVLSHSNSWGGEWDGGAGTDTLTVFGNADQYVLTKGDGVYTIGFLEQPFNSPNPPAVNPDFIGTLRSVEQIQFADQLVTLDATPSRDSGATSQTFAPTVPITGTAAADKLTGDAAGNLITGLGGNDTLSGGGGADTLEGGAGDDFIFGDGFEVRYALAEANQVFRLYQATFNRAPDGTGHKRWTSELFTGESMLADVREGFVGSPEFQNTYAGLSDADFVKQMYINVLDRDFDQGEVTQTEIDNWTGRINANFTRADVVNGFAESPQLINNTTQAANKLAVDSNPAIWADDVYRLYQATLGRAPDEMGFTNWAGRLADGQSLTTVIGGFTNSDEFTNTYGQLTDDGDFVKLLYNNVLGRDFAQGQVAQSEVDGWVNQLSPTFTRANIVEGFSQSQEFIRNSAPDVKAYIRELGTDDVIDGGAGANTLAGGRLADQFVFRQAEASTDLVLDLEAWDFVSLQGFGYTSVADARSHITQGAQGAVFSDQGTTVTFDSFAATAFTDDMILI